MGKYKEIDPQKISTYSINDRPSKVHNTFLVKPYQKGEGITGLMKSIPSILIGKDFNLLLDKLVYAIKNEKPILFMMGAHVIKVGLSPLIIDFLDQKIISGLVLNGAGAIHDMEMSCFGQTSEDVAEMLKTGQFGMVEETADLLNGSLDRFQNENLGFGEAMGKRIVEDAPKFQQYSLLGNAYKNDIPATVHVGVGTDIVHQHASADGRLIGEASLRDFRILAELLAQLNDGGVVLLFGSSVIIPEVFLKALTVARNIYGKVENFTTANFDMIKHYRPLQNVVSRPTRTSGVGLSFTGHHEIMLPLLFASLKECL